MPQNQQNGVSDHIYNSVNFFILVKGGAAKFIGFVENVFDAKENAKSRTPDKDGSLIHAEIQLGNAMILVSDSKENWPFTPAFPQVYVDDAQSTLQKAVAFGGEIITAVSPFYGGLTIARFKDPWRNIWWLFAKAGDGQKSKEAGENNTDWQKEKPSYIYTSLMSAMENL